MQAQLKLVNGISLVKDTHDKDARGYARLVPGERDNHAHVAPSNLDRLPVEVEAYRPDRCAQSESLDDGLVIKKEGRLLRARDRMRAAPMHFVASS